MSAGIIIGVLAFLAFLAFIGYSIYNISSNTICDSSGCVSPGGNWLKDKCTCTCNPGYSGVNCQTKSKHVSDLETACKNKTGKDCADCLKTNITKNLTGNASDVQQFKDDFTSSITAINNICCPKNCSNTSGTACDNCVKTTNKDTSYKLGNKTYEINSSGCISYWTKNVNGGITQNNIAKNILCNNSGGSDTPSPPPQSLPKCNISGGVVGECQVIDDSSIDDFTHKRWSTCPNISTNINGVNYQCRAPSNDEYSKGKKMCLPDTKKPCLAPINTKAVELYNTDKCSKRGWYENSKCQCPGMEAKLNVNPIGFTGDLAKYYIGDKCQTYCNFENDLPNGCPCGDDTSASCVNSCKGKTGTNNPGRKCE